MSAVADPDTRRRELAAIHVGKKQLALDDATYRAMLWAVARVRSAADLDYAGRRAVIEHLRSRGFNAAPRADFGTKPTVSADRQALLDKIEAQLAARGLHWNYAAGILKRVAKVDAFRFATAGDLGKVIAALTYAAQRKAASAGRQASKGGAQ